MYSFIGSLIRVSVYRMCVCKLTCVWKSKSKHTVSVRSKFSLPQCSEHTIMLYTVYVCFTHSSSVYFSIFFFAYEFRFRCVFFYTFTSVAYMVLYAVFKLSHTHAHTHTMCICIYQPYFVVLVGVFFDISSWYLSTFCFRLFSMKIKNTAYVCILLLMLSHRVYVCIRTNFQLLLSEILNFWLFLFVSFSLSLCLNCLRFYEHWAICFFYQLSCMCGYVSFFALSARTHTHTPSSSSSYKIYFHWLHETTMQNQFILNYVSSRERKHTSAKERQRGSQSAQSSHYDQWTLEITHKHMLFADEIANNMFNIMNNSIHISNLLGFESTLASEQNILSSTKDQATGLQQKWYLQKPNQWTIGK